MLGQTRLTLCAALLGLSSAAWAQGAAPEFARRDPQVHRADAGRALADANRSGGRLNAVAALLRQQGRDDMALASMREGASRAGRNGVTHLRVEQTVEGLPVYGAYAKAAFGRNGELMHLIDHLAAVPAAAMAAPAVGAGQALAAAMAQVHPGVTAQFRAAGSRGSAQLFDGGAFFHNAPEVSAVAVPLDNGALARGWLVQTWTQKDNQLHHTLVSGDGRVLNVENRTASDLYNVFAADPGKSVQTLTAGPGAGNAESPSGWLAGAQTTLSLNGNNVRAYLDAVSNNADDGGGAAVTNAIFTAVADFSLAPSAAVNKAVAAQNLFYLNNRLHDILYSHGFTESAGNFQVNNFGKGGAGNDAVNAEAQDGGGTDNANFATPADGSAPRMQMYLWTGAGATHQLAFGAHVRDAMGAAFGPALTVSGRQGQVVAASPADGCRRINGAVSGKIARIARGTCDFVVKVKNAQSAGAIGVVIVNNNEVNKDEIFAMGGTGVVSIPSVMISYNSGTLLGNNISATMSKKALQPLQLDASLDLDIVAHEYCHGLTWRMIGGMSGPIAGAIGEGMGDGCAMLINADKPLPDVVGEYSAGNVLGIRRYPYTNYPLKYGSVTGAEVHDDGEIYAAIVWRMIELFGSDGRERLFDYIVEGMDLTPSTPKFENMRDGILAAVGPGNPNGDCTKVWQAFAQYGVGVGAKATIKGTKVTVTQSLTPGSCN